MWFSTFAGLVSGAVALEGHGNDPKYEATGIKYESGGKCLSIGNAFEGHNRNEQFHLSLVDCSSSTEWSERFLSTETFQISASNSGVQGGESCLNFLGSGSCEDGSEVIVGKCEQHVSHDVPASRFVFDPDSKKIVSDFCSRSACVDVSGGGLVLTSCKHAATWKRHGSAAPPTIPKLHYETPASPINGYHWQWPLPTHMAGIGESGYPEYWGNNNAEACPESQKFGCESGQCRCRWPATDDFPNHIKKSSKSGMSGAPPMTRSQIVQRAIVWVAHHFGGQDDDVHGHQSGVEACSASDSAESCPKVWHGGACCALPSMAWNITGCIEHPGGKAHRINCEDMRPGDGIVFHGTHVALFARWTDKASKRYKFFERHGPVVMSNGRIENEACLRRSNVIEDVEPDNVPLALEDHVLV
jgi:hypothetical protein